MFKLKIPNLKKIICLVIISLCCVVVSMFLSASSASADQVDTNIASVVTENNKVTYTLKCNSYTDGDTLLKNIKLFGQKYDFLEINNGAIDPHHNLIKTTPFRIAAWDSKHKKESYSSVISSYPGVYYDRVKYDYKNNDGKYSLDTIEFSQNIENIECDQFHTMFTLETYDYSNSDYLLWNFGKDDCYRTNCQEFDYVKMGNGKIIFDDEIGISYKISAWYSGDKDGSYRETTITDPKGSTHSLKYDYEKDGRYLVDHIEISQNIKDIIGSDDDKTFFLESNNYSNNSYLLTDFGTNDTFSIGGQAIDSVMIKDGKIIIDNETNTPYIVSAWYSEDYENSFTENYCSDNSDSVFKFNYNYKKDGKYLIDNIRIRVSENIRNIEKDDYHSTIELCSSTYEKDGYVLSCFNGKDCLETVNQKIDFVKMDNDKIIVNNKTKAPYKMCAWYSGDKENSYREETFNYCDDTFSDYSPTHFLSYDFKDKKGNYLIDHIEFSQNILDIYRNKNEKIITLENTEYKNNSKLLYAFGKEKTLTVGNSEILSVMLLNGDVCINYNNEKKSPFYVSVWYSDNKKTSFTQFYVSDFENSNICIQYGYGNGRRYLIDHIAFSDTKIELDTKEIHKQSFKDSENPDSNKDSENPKDKKDDKPTKDDNNKTKKDDNSSPKNEEKPTLDDKPTKDDKPKFNDDDSSKNEAKPQSNNAETSINDCPIEFGIYDEFNNKIDTNNPNWISDFAMKKLTVHVKNVSSEDFYDNIYCKMTYKNGKIVTGYLNKAPKNDFFVAANEDYVLTKSLVLTEKIANFELIVGDLPDSNNTLIII